MSTCENLPSQEAAGPVLSQHDQVLPPKNSKDAPSPTSTQDSRLSEWSHIDPSFRDGLSDDSSTRSPFPLLEATSSILNEGFRGQPLSVSSGGPPATDTPLSEKKIQWYGNWHDGWEPRWGATEPRIEDIRKTAQPFMRFCGINPDDFSVAPFRQGLWNKLYIITSKDKITGTMTERIFRVPLPVNPWFKLQSEVATMEFVRQKTSIPIPKVYVFDSSMTNALGFEWMIMEKLDGRTYREARASMSQEEKNNLHRTIAVWVDQLSEHRFDRIGSLYRDDHFLGPWRTQNKVFRGPFQNEAQLYRSIVELNLVDILNPRQLDLAKRAWAAQEDLVVVTTPEDEDQSLEPTTVYGEGAFKPSGVQNACFSVLDLLPSIEDQLAEQQRSYVLHHFDISQDNVLVDETGAAVALLDWENLTTASLSQIHPWPSIIDPTRHERPKTPPQRNEHPPEWYVSALDDYSDRLAADAFMSQLGKLKSSWPQTPGEAQDFESEFEEDLAELGSLVKEIYTGWAEMEICERLKKKYYKMFLPTSSHQEQKAPQIPLDLNKGGEVFASSTVASVQCCRCRVNKAMNLSRRVLHVDSHCDVVITKPGEVCLDYIRKFVLESPLHTVPFVDVRACS